MTLTAMAIIAALCVIAGTYPLFVPRRWLAPRSRPMTSEVETDR